MKLTTPQLERIVTEVMVELLRAGARSTSAPVPPAIPSRQLVAVASPLPVNTVKPPANAVIFSERVITGALLEERARGVKQIVVPPSVVLTPSAKDFVRKNGIEIAKETSSGGKPREAVRWQLLVSKADPGLLSAADAWTKECGWRSRYLVGTAKEAAAKAVSVVAAAEAAGVVIATDRADEACLLANRNDKVRAVVVSSVRGLQVAVDHVGPNVFVIDPASRGVFELKQLLTQIVKSGKPVSKLP